LVPKSCIYLKVFTNDNGWHNIAEVYATIIIWKEMFKTFMGELTYLAEMANLKFSLETDDNGLLLVFKGFNSSMKNYCSEIF